MKKKLLAISVLAAVSSQANAFQFDTGDDWAIRWDNTFKVNVMSRVAKQDDDVVTPQAGANWFLYDDSDLSVDRSGGGLVSTRIDVISEMDVIWRDNFGFRISGSGWYDPQYEEGENDHPGDRKLTWSNPSADVGDYSHEAEDLHYAGGELLDAFVFANFDIGDTALGVRAGRHTIYWGNSLLFGGAIHGIGGAMAPVDFNKALSVPGSEAKELFMPTGKISSTFQVTDNLTLNAYYGYEFQANRVPEDGTYWALAEGLSENSEFMTLFPGDPIRSGFKPRGYSEDEGDFGFNLQYYFDRWNLETSFIYINYTDKNLHGLIGSPGSPNTPQPGDGGEGDMMFAAGAVAIGEAKWVFKNDIDLFGISLAKEIAGISWGFDVIYRQDTGVNMDFASALFAGGGAPLSSFDSDDYLGPVADTLSVNISALGLLNSQWGLWDGGTWIFEATFTEMTDCNENCGDNGEPDLVARNLHEDRWTSQIAGVFKPTWYQVRAGWDLSIPMTVAYNIDGENTPQAFGGNEELGNASIGVSIDINQLWKFDLTYTNRFGPVNNGIGGSLKDRDNIALTAKRTW